MVFFLYFLNLVVRFVVLFFFVRWNCVNFWKISFFFWRKRDFFWVGRGYEWKERGRGG